MQGKFEKNIFINCPFDDNYRALLKPLLFTIKCCGFFPRIASERMDSSEVRLDKIIEIITESKYSIHDLSRIKSSKKGEYYRLNMPLEIGIDLGCKQFHHDIKYREKRSLILEGEKFSLQKALSDLSGSDVGCHHDDAETMVEVVRNWMVEVGYKMPGPNKIWDKYNIFYADLYAHFSSKGFKNVQIDSLSIPEFLDFLSKWLRKNKI